MFLYNRNENSMLQQNTAKKRKVTAKARELNPVNAKAWFFINTWWMEGWTSDNLQSTAEFFPIYSVIFCTNCVAVHYVHTHRCKARYEVRE